MKMVILMRTDLDMSVGKQIAQGSHAAVALAVQADPDRLRGWMRQGMKKIVLKVGSENELKSLLEQAKDKKLQTQQIKDAGSTELPPGTTTCGGIGPHEDDRIDAITSHLRPL